MARTIDVFISDKDTYFAEGLARSLINHLEGYGFTVTFTNNLNMMAFADIIFLTKACISSFRPSDFHTLEGCVSKSVLVTSDYTVTPAFLSVKWVLYRRTGVSDMLSLVDYILGIRKNDVSDYALGACFRPYLTGLSPRQRQVMWLYSQGFKQKKISYILGIDVRTVSSHKRALMKQYQLTCDADLRNWLISKLLLSA
ncbi:MULTISPECIES: helix-turn-helix transcriptional regulator [unclassified Pantoea]|uniref:helix-turn-helix transcriptional regulator n=1 Tax=unclassified Pantoea TaxID=2630326 RepID=UPI003AB72AD2